MKTEEIPFALTYGPKRATLAADLKQNLYKHFQPITNRSRCIANPSEIELIMKMLQTFKWSISARQGYNSEFTLGKKAFSIYDMQF